MSDGWVDVSVRFDAGTPAWPGDTPWSCGWAWEMAQGASVNVSCLNGSPHVGTHADAPLHVKAGAPGADALVLSAFRGPALVVDVSSCEGALTLRDLEQAGLVAGTVRLLLRTARTVGSGAFPASWPSLEPATASELTRAGLRLLGVDCPSVDDRESKTLAVHHALFDGGATVLENLDLRAVPAGAYELLALPMPVGAIDAAPVRALLRPQRQSVSPR
jgi:arylformamidase